MTAYLFLKKKNGRTQLNNYQMKNTLHAFSVDFLKAMETNLAKKQKTASRNLAAVRKELKNRKKLTKTV